MKPLPRDAHRPLMRALREIIDVDGLPQVVRGPSSRENTAPAAKTSLIVESLGYEPWASATFVGQTHWLEVRLEGERDSLQRASAQIDAQLRDVDIPIPGAIVADIGIQIAPIVAGAEGAWVCSMRLEVLTIDD